MSAEFVRTREYLWWLMERLSIDHDNTICNTKGIVTEEFNKDFGTNHSALEILSWHGLASWAMALGKTQEEAIAINDAYWYNEQLVNRARPNLGAIEFLDRVKGFRPIINSSRPFEQRDATRRWYAEEAPVISPEQVIVGLPDVIVPKDAFTQGISKVCTVKLFRCRAHIEDVPLHAKLVLDYTDADVFLLSDDASLDRAYPARLMRFGSVDGNIPDFTGLLKLLSR